MDCIDCMDQVEFSSQVFPFCNCIYDTQNAYIYIKKKKLLFCNIYSSGIAANGWLDWAQAFQCINIKD